MIQIFMGNGEHSAAECYDLHRKLEKALSLISALQQPPRSNTEETAMEQALWMDEAQFDIETIAEFIYEKLTGNSLVEEQPEVWETTETWTLYSEDYRTQVKRRKAGK